MEEEGWVDEEKLREEDEEDAESEVGMWEVALGGRGGVTCPGIVIREEKEERRPVSTANSFLRPCCSLWIESHLSSQAFSFLFNENKNSLKDEKEEGNKGLGCVLA